MLSHTCYRYYGHIRLLIQHQPLCLFIRLWFTPFGDYIRSPMLLCFSFTHAAPDTPVSYCFLPFIWEQYFSLPSLITRSALTFRAYEATSGFTFCYGLRFASIPFRTFVRQFQHIQSPEYIVSPATSLKRKLWGLDFHQLEKQHSWHAIRSPKVVDALRGRTFWILRFWFRFFSHP